MIKKENQNQVWNKKHYNLWNENYKWNKKLKVGYWTRYKNCKLRWLRPVLLFHRDIDFVKSYGNLDTQIFTFIYKS